MNPTLKKILGAVVIKQVVDQINERRAPKRPSIWARLGRLVLIGGGAAVGFYAYKNGAFQPLLDKLGKGSSSEGSTKASSNGSAEGNDITFRSEDQPLTAPVH